MGVVAARALWAVAAMLLTVPAPALHWRLGAVAVLAGLMGLVTANTRWARLGAAAVALGAAPAFVAVAQQGSAVVVLSLLAALAGLLLRATALPAAVPALVLSVGLLEAARLLALSPASVALAAPLALASLGAAAAGAHPGGRLAAGIVFAIGLSQTAPALWLRDAPPETVEQARTLARRGLAGPHTAALVAQPELGLAAIHEDPSLHALAIALAPTVGVDRLLSAGWFPDAAPLPAALRIEVARRLDTFGMGGRALRILRRGRQEPDVAWAWGLLARAQGHDEAAFATLVPPPGTPELPGTLRPEWELLSNGGRQMNVHCRSQLDELALVVEATGYQGPPELVIEIDGRPVGVLRPPDRVSVQSVAVQLAPGPHRIEARLTNDLSGPGGDRNVTVLAIHGLP